MNRSLLNTSYCKRYLLMMVVSILSLSVCAQTVTIVPTGTPSKPNLVPVDNAVTFSINPIVFGACMNNLSYSWAIVNAAKDTVFKSTSNEPKYNFTRVGIYTVNVTVKTLPGGYCTANVTRSATSTIRVAPEGPGGVPKPNMFSANALGTYISAYTMDDLGQILSGPYDYFDPFPADNAITAALAMDDKGNYFYVPTFMSGPNPLTATQVATKGVVEVWAVDKNANKPPVTIARFDMNGSSNTELGLFRMGLDQKGNAWILAGDGASMFAAKFKTNGTKVLNLSDITTFPVPFESGSAADFQSGDLAFDNNGNMYVLAGSSSGTNIYTMSTNSAAPVLSKRWKVTNAAGQNFGLSVTGTVFDSKGSMYFSALDGIYFIDHGAVNPVTGTAVVRKISENFGLMDLATSQFPTAWTPPFDGTPLAVKLLRFTGVSTAEKVQLNWQVSSNEKGNRFELEKSHNGTGFKTLTLVVNTDKQGDEAYSFTDATPVTEKVYYRLKIVSKDGSTAYSNIVFFGAQTRQSSTLMLLQNPVYNAANLNYTATENTVAEIAVYSAAGIKVSSQRQSLQKGNNSIIMPVNNLLRGVYVLEVKDGAASQVVKFVKQ